VTVTDMNFYLCNHTQEMCADFTKDNNPAAFDTKCFNIHMHCGKDDC